MMGKSSFSLPPKGADAGGFDEFHSEIRSAVSFPYFYEHEICARYGYTFEQFQRKISSALQRERRTLTMVARGHGKTELMSAYAIWKAKYNPGIQILIVSSALDQSTRILSRIKNRLADIGSLQYLLPFMPSDGVDKYRQRDWSKTSITLSNGSRIICSPFSPSIRGMRNHVIIADDIIRDDGKMSREQVINLFNSVVVPSVDDPRTSEIHVVGTPIYPDDLLAYLKSTGVYVVNEFPALDPSGNPIFPSRFSKEELLNLRKQVGEIVFSREFMLRPIPSGASIFPQSLVDSALVPGVPASFDFISIGVDVAMSDSASADNSAFAVVGWHDGVAYLIQLDVAKGWDADQHISHITSLWKSYSADEVVVEKNGLSFSLVEKMESDGVLPIVPFTTTRKKKEIMIGRLKTMLEQGLLKISISNSDVLRDELVSIIPKPNGRIEAVSGHDDTVMALALAVSSNEITHEPAPRFIGFVSLESDDGSAFLI